MNHTYQLPTQFWPTNDPLSDVFRPGWWTTTVPPSAAATPTAAAAAAAEAAAAAAAAPSAAATPGACSLLPQYRTLQHLLLSICHPRGANATLVIVWQGALMLPQQSSLPVQQRHARK